MLNDFLASYITRAPSGSLLVNSSLSNRPIAAAKEAHAYQSSDITPTANHKQHSTVVNRPVSSLLNKQDTKDRNGVTSSLTDLTKRQAWTNFDDKQQQQQGQQMPATTNLNAELKQVMSARGEQRTTIVNNAVDEHDPFEVICFLFCHFHILRCRMTFVHWLLVSDTVK
jgi:hypothetical protein